jgi:hypothetical protein
LWWFQRQGVGHLIKDVHDIETIHPLTRLRRAGQNLFVELEYRGPGYRCCFPVFIDQRLMLVWGHPPMMPGKTRLVNGSDIHSPGG